MLVNGRWVEVSKFDGAQVDEWLEAIDEEVEASNTRAREDAQADACLEAA